MEKSRVCVNRTINLAKQKKCAKTNLLVYEKPKVSPPQPCPPPTHVPHIAAIPAKKIRVCTGQEMKKMCPPKLCDCQPKKRIGFLGALFGLLGLGVKTVIAGGVVYLTWDAGIWGDADESIKLYQGFCDCFAPFLCPPDHSTPPPPNSICEAEQDLMCVPPPPNIHCCDKMPIDHEKSGHFLKETWNCLVTCVFGAITNFPDNVIGVFHGVKENMANKVQVSDDARKCEAHK